MLHHPSKPRIDVTDQKNAPPPPPSGFQVEATVVDRGEALFSEIPRQEFVARKTEPRDIDIIDTFVNDETKMVFQNFDAGKIYEKSCFSLVLTDPVEFGRVVAHASFTDSPMDPRINIDGKRWKSEEELEGVTPLNTLFMHFFVYNTEYQDDSCLMELIINTFQNCHPISFIIVESPRLDYSGPYMFTQSAREVNFSPKPKVQKKLILYAKDRLFPHLFIREGREHDLDDLSPLLALDTKEMEDNFNRSYLPDVIAMGDRNNQSIIGEYSGEAVGILNVSTDIDYTLLNNNFHLEPFHGLYKPYDNDEIRLKPTESRLLDTSIEEVVHDDFVPSSFKVRREKGSLDNFDMDENESILSIGGESKKTAQLYPKSPAAAAHAEVKFKSEMEILDGLRGGQLDDGLEMVREKGVLRSIVGSATLLKAKSDSGSDSEDIDAKVSSQFKLLNDVEKILGTLEEQGMSLKDAKLPPEAVETLNNAKELINNCVVNYLHRTLITEALFPIEDLNEPAPCKYHGIPNAVCIKLLAIEKRYEMRVLDLIQGAFLNFPNREYCIVSAPLEVKEPFWMKFFYRVTRRRDSLYPHSLAVLHRCIFTTQPKVRRAKCADYANILILLESLHYKKKIINDLEQSLVPQNNPYCFQSFVVEVSHKETNVIIGLAIMSPDQNSAFYQLYYDLDQFTYHDFHEEKDYAYVHHYVMNPVFQLFSKTFTKEIMRIMKKDCIFYTLPQISYHAQVKAEHQTLPNNFDDFIPLTPRKRLDYTALSLTDIYDDLRQPRPDIQEPSMPICVFHLAKKFTFEPKCTVSPRLVFVGASQTAICCLAKLISSAHLTFRNITLISPNGIPGLHEMDEIRNMFFARSGGISLSWRHDEDWYQRLGIKSLINVVYGHVTKVFRNIKAVLVNGRRVVPYDILVFATGREFVRADCPEPEILDGNFSKFKKSTYKPQMIEHGRRMSYKAKELIRLTPKPKNMFTINSDIDATLALNFLRSYIPFELKRHIVVHGCCLEAYCCIRALLELGISEKRIIVVTHPGDEMPWEKTHSYRDTAKLRDVMSETLKKIGIHVIQNYYYKKSFVDKTTGLLNRVYFYSPTEDIANMSIPCFAYFGFCVRRVSDEIASICSESYIAYNNGILINTGFQTSDPDIYAAGPCAVYQKKLCAERFNHCYFSSEEVGNVLADLLLKRVGPITTELQMNVVPVDPPIPVVMSDPIVRFAELPGDWYYLYVGRPGLLPGCCHDECTCKDCECGTSIITGSTNKKEDDSQNYFRLWLNGFHRVEGLECVAMKKFSPANLASLYGHHEVLLNRLLENIDKGEVDDLYDHFCQPWVAALCSDRWVDFRMELQDLFAEYEIAPNIRISNFIRDYLDNLDNEESLQVDPNIIRRIFDVTGLQAAVEARFLDFLQFNHSILPMYATPHFVEKTFEERKTSPFYMPHSEEY